MVDNRKNKKKFMCKDSERSLCGSHRQSNRPCSDRPRFRGECSINYFFGRFLKAAAVTGVVLLAPSPALSSQPPLWCEGKIGNTYAGGCDVYFNTLVEAATTVCNRWIASGQSRRGFPSFPTGPMEYESFYGSWQRYSSCPAAGINSLGVKIDDSITAVVFPVCRPIDGVRATPSGVDEATACPGGSVDMYRGPTSNSETSGSALSCQAEALKNPASGQPIYPLSGKKTKTIDLGVRVGGVNVALQYDSARQLAAAAVGKTAKDFGDLPAFGPLWFSSLHRKLLLNSGAADLKVLRGDGTHSGFWNNGAGIVTSASNPDTLTAITGGYRYWNAKTGALELYNTAGQISGLSDTAGNSLKFIYSAGASGIAPAAGYLIRAADNQGRSIAFEYSLPAGGVAARDGLVSRMIGPDGSVVQFAYDSAGNLALITWPDGHTRQLLYEHPTHRWALTGELDENGARYSTFSYDDSGRAIATELANGVYRYSVIYDTPPLLTTTTSYDSSSKMTYRYLDVQPPVNTVLSEPSGQTTSMISAAVNGRAVLVGKSKSAGSGCAASNRAATFDGNGNLLSVDDYTGKRICLGYDSANREVTRIEGLSNTANCSGVLPAGSTLPAGARRITTSWHPDWRVPIQITEALRSTTYVYNGQPDPFNGNAIATCSAAPSLPNGKAIPLICKKIERALQADGTVDPAAPIETRTYTYDRAGQVLTATDSNGRSTGYSYYTDATFSSTPPAGAVDPDFDLVTLLLKGTGINGSTTVVDDSIFHRPVSVWGDAKISTAQSRFGGSAIAFDGVQDYVSIPYEAGFAFGAEDFTIETFLYKNANHANSSRIWNVNGDYYDGVALSIDPNGNFSVYLSTNGTSWTHSLPVVANLANGQWYHLAVARSGGSVYAFVNGVRYTVTTALGATSLIANGTARVIGGQNGTDRPLNGFIDEFRITKGKARYTADFTPPPQPYPTNGPIPVPADIGHTVGDLQSITNAAGQVTQFTQYDRAGRVRQMIDPKGVVTDITYTPRGWVSTVTATAPGGSARVTSYSYDGVGQLTGVTQPDGSTLSYSYDAAHRLVGVTDAKGNSVNYTLDNVGNRIAEDIKDPTGVLQRNISRSFDALNRLQQVSGAAQ